MDYCGALMNIWATAVLQVGNTNVGIFVDDRTFWMTGPEAHLRVPTILAISQKVDHVFGFRENKSKTQVATSSPDMFPNLAAVLPPDCSAPKLEVDLLGLHYDLQKKHTEIRQSCLDKFHHRIQRVSVASRSQYHRRRLLQSTVLPCVSWAGAFGWVSAQKLTTMRHHEPFWRLRVGFLSLLLGTTFG